MGAAAVVGEQWRRERERERGGERARAGAMRYDECCTSSTTPRLNLFISADEPIPVAPPPSPRVLPIPLPLPLSSAQMRGMPRRSARDAISRCARDARRRNRRSYFVRERERERERKRERERERTFAALDHSEVEHTIRER